MDGLDDRYSAPLAAVGAEADRIGPGRLTSHWPVVGGAFDRDVLVVGQAVFGWIPDWTASDAATAAGRARILADTRGALGYRADPMSWVAGNRVRNAPFWGTVRSVADAFTPGDVPWYSRVAWANLYPIAPNEPKGNADGPLRAVQTETAVRFLDAVVEELDPRLVLVLAGPFIWTTLRSHSGSARTSPR